MERISKSIEVDCPVGTVYNQWTQFEEFPRFMEGVKRVTQLDDKRLHWEAEIAGKDKEWDARITDQVPDQRIAWQSESGEQTSGIVTFQPA
ncbi:MAG TPA: SRPBCC family protein, partial [Candidatus Udaeobacter sp.]|nr:SRPBCC family protein [Candidatus Udaeobacter sp.]